MEGQGLEKLEAAFREGRLLSPRWDGPGFVDLAQALGVLAGGRPRAEASPAALGLLDRIGTAEKHVFILADGLGLEMLGRLPEGGFLRRHLAGELRAVFPSTTAAALATLLTGDWPGAHASLAWHLYLPERDLSIRPLPFDSRFGNRPLGGMGVPAGEVFALPGRFFGPRGCCAVVPKDLVGSTFTSLNAGPSLGYGEGGDWLRALGQALDLPDTRFVYCYLPEPDRTGHDQGCQGAPYLETLAGLERQLEAFWKGRPGGARLILSADHGMVDSLEAGRYRFGASDPLVEPLAALPSGEARVPFFHVKPERGRDFVEAFRKVFGDDFILVSGAEARRSGLFGPSGPCPRAAARLGDWMAVSAGGRLLDFESPFFRRDKPMVGHHGGLSPAEMRIPLVLA